MGKKVEQTRVFLYDRVWEKILWCVGRFDNIRDTFAACRRLSEGLGRSDAFMIPSITEEDVIFFDSDKINRFCFKIKVQTKKIDEEVIEDEKIKESIS